MEIEPSQPVATTTPDLSTVAGGIGRLSWFIRLGILVGILLRVGEYCDMRELYIDEGALLKNLVGAPILEFSHEMKQDQLAPPGFLAVERVMVRLPIPSKAAGRLFPLACGLATMLLIAPLARRYLAPRAVAIAVWMLALADHLIYYSSEIKPYVCDLLAAMITLLLAAPPDLGEPSKRRLIRLGAWGAIAPWFSFPVVFVLAGVGLHLIARSWRAEGRRGAAKGLLVCGAWFVSFLGCFLLSRSIAPKRDFLWVWWDFAFLPIPPKSWTDARFTLETIANVFINPGSVLTPFDFIATAVLASLLAILGAVALGRRWPGGLFMVVAPLAVHLAVSALRQYPFHGRLILSLVPTYHLLLCEGMAAVGRITRPWATTALALLFVGAQAGDVFWNQWVLPKNRSRPFDTHGDLKDDMLDELDRIRRPWRPPAPASMTANSISPAPPADSPATAGSAPPPAPGTPGR